MQDNLSQKPESNTDEPVFKIKHRFTGKIIFKLQCKSFQLCVEAAVKSRVDLQGADLRDADLLGAYLRGADLQGANLRGADLRDADLRDANLRDADLLGAYLRDAYLQGAKLRGAYLRGAYLQGADLRDAYLQGADGEKTKVQYIPLQILGLRWDIIIFDKDMRIGCEYHSIADWFLFNDDRISQMDSHALIFWTTNKPILQALCAANWRE